MDLEHERRLATCEARTKDNSRRLDEVENRQDKLDDLVQGIREWAARAERTEKDVAEVKKEIKCMNERPRKWQDVAITSVISALVGGVIGYVLFLMGIGG